MISLLRLSYCASLRRLTGAWAGVLCCGAFWVTSVDAAKLRADPESIEYGQSSTLSWSASGPSFLIGIGKVDATGKLAVTPTLSTNYLLISEDDGNVEYATAAVQILDARDPLIFPSFDSYKAGAIAYFPGKKLEDVAGRIYNSLMTMAGQVNPWHVPGDKFFRLYSLALEIPDLRRPSDDKGIRTRRAFYAIQVNNKPPGTAKFPVEVRAKIEYQRRAEDSWHPDPDPDNTLTRTVACLFLQRVHAPCSD